MNSSLPFLLCACLLVSSCGCDESESTAWTPVAESALDTVQKSQRVAAFRAKDAMFTELSGALMAAIKAEGPAAAIDVCRSEAPQVAARVSKAEGVRIGRTSFRLRNPENTPPAWAASLVENQAADNAYVVGSDGSLGVLLPIRTQNPCLTCHGDPASVAADVQAELARWYPEDEAMGFAQGDLRGYFWIEVPAAAP